MWIVLLVVVILAILGGLFILLRTANAPKLPPDYKPKPYDDEHGGGW